MKDLTALVTGGAGFIGSHIVDALLAAGASVRVLDNFSSGRRENLAHCEGDIQVIEGDLRDADTCVRACAGAKLLFHHAALGSVPRSMADPSTCLAVNVSGTANVFAAARDAGIDRVVFASSSSVYGDSERLPKREGEEGEPLSPYALSKAMGEQLAQTFARCFEMSFVGLRYFNVYGPRQSPRGPYAAVIPRFISACAAGDAPLIHGDGLQSRDFIFISDVVRANLLAATAELSGAHVVNIGAGNSTTINDLAETIIDAFGAELKTRHVEARAGDARYSEADTSAAEALFGFRAQLSLAEGLQQSISSRDAASLRAAAARQGTSRPS